MHSDVRNDDERAGHDAQRNDIGPQRHGVETERAENGGAGHFDVEAVFVVDEGQVADFVDDEGFEAVVEDGELGACVSVC